MSRLQGNNKYLLVGRGSTPVVIHKLSLWSKRETATPIKTITFLLILNLEIKNKVNPCINLLVKSNMSRNERRWRSLFHLTVCKRWSIVSKLVQLLFTQRTPSDWIPANSCFWGFCCPIAILEPQVVRQMKISFLDEKIKIDK